MLVWICILTMTTFFNLIADREGISEAAQGIPEVRFRRCFLFLN